MVYTEKELYSNNHIFNILNESTYIDNYILNEITIPIIKRESNYIIKYDDLNYISENMNIDYDSLLSNIIKINNIDNNIMIAFNESNIIIDPDIINGFNNICIIPESKNSLAYKYISYCLENYIGNDLYNGIVYDTYLPMFLNEAVSTRRDALGPVLTKINNVINSYQNDYKTNLKTMEPSGQTSDGRLTYSIPSKVKAVGQTIKQNADELANPALKLIDLSIDYPGEINYKDIYNNVKTHLPYYKMQATNYYNKVRGAFTGKYPDQNVEQWKGHKIAVLNDQIRQYKDKLRQTQDANTINSIRQSINTVQNTINDIKNNRIQPQT